MNRDARALVEAIRNNRARAGGLDAFLVEYDLSSAEGVITRQPAFSGMIAGFIPAHRAAMVSPVVALRNE